MSGFDAWLPPWQRFISWSGRLSRRTFFGGYIALCFFSAILGMAGFGVLEVLGLHGWLDAFGGTLIAIGFVPVSALFAQRAHDIGWSAFVPLVVFLVLGAPMLIMLDYAGGIFGHTLARTAYSAGLDVGRMMMFALIGNGVWMLFALYLVVRKGHAAANRFGPAPT